MIAAVLVVALGLVYLYNDEGACRGLDREGNQTVANTAGAMALVVLLVMAAGSCDRSVDYRPPGGPEVEHQYP